MTPTRWRLAAPWWLWLITLMAVLLFGVLSNWQYQRGVHKRAVSDAYRNAVEDKAEPFTQDTAALSKQFRLVEVAGVYQPRRLMFLDNQGHHGRPGYHVWTPLQLPSGEWVVVNRGWVPAPPDRQNLPSIETPSEPQVMRGYWRPLPQAGMASGPTDCETQGAWPRIVVYPSHAQLSCLMERPVLDGVMLLHPEENGGYVREWSPSTGMPPEKHFGYALQWLSLMLLAIILFLKFNLKRS